MGLCFSCKKSKYKAKGSKICSQIQSAVSPVHITHEATCSNYIITTISVLPTDDSMATFTNRNITNPIKGLVSKKRNRYKQDGFDLDLTYITSKVIAMGYPASNLEGFYRNNIDDVVKFLQSKHKDHYYIYNLCSERSYDKSKFYNRVRNYPFDDHNPPKIESIQPFCKDVQDWLAADELNVAVVHCKAGKGRTGTMICCYLLHSGLSRTAEHALSFYGQTRTQDRKGVTIPSQVRYVNYYEQLLNANENYREVSMYIKEFVFEPGPTFAGGQSCISFSISHQTIQREGDKLTQKCKKLRKNDSYDYRRGVSPFKIQLDYCLPLTGDIKVEFFNKPKIGKKVKLFQFWFNTFFVSERVSVNGFTEHEDDGTFVLTFDKRELDIVSKKDKQNKNFSADFKLSLLLYRIPNLNSCPPTYARMPSSQDQGTPSEESSDSSDDTNESNEEDEWDSVLDTLDPRGVGYRILSECEIASQLTSSNSDQQAELLLV